MRVGFIGLGKLGLPCAVGMALKGHEVKGFDINPENMTKKPRVYKETGPDGRSDFNPYLDNSTVQFDSLENVCAHAEIVFVAIQTPHDPRFEGVTRITDERKDFDYSYLEACVKDLAQVIKKDTVVVIISTVLPGTVAERVTPLCNKHMKLCYNPYFIAMGTTMQDFFNPEFILCGGNDEKSLDTLEAFYKTIADAPCYRTTIENAELIKVAYNTFIGMKIAFVNTLMEICHKTPNTDVDAVSKALKLANKRLLSDKYLYGGMGDGGGCHPRDNIALSWLSRKLDLSYDWFHNVMIAREEQTEWLADLMCSYELPKAILGYSFKAETNITVGSPALLLKNILEERKHSVWLHDPKVEEKTVNISTMEPHVFLIGTKHEALTQYTFPKGSVVLDPWRYIPPQDGVTVVPLGVGKSSNTPVTQKIEKETKIVELSTELSEIAKDTEEDSSLVLVDTSVS